MFAGFKYNNVKSRVIAHNSSPRKYTSIWIAFGLVLFPATVESIHSFVLGETIQAAMLLASVAASVGFGIYASSVIRFSFTPIVVAFLFACSYPLRHYYVASNIESYTLTGGFATIGGFDFSPRMTVELHLASFAGIAGIVIGVNIARLMVAGQITRRAAGLISVMGPQLEKLFVAWIVLSVGVSAICIAYGIGQSGISPIALPFKLTGILNHSRLFVLPFLGWIVFGLAVQQARTKLVVFMLATVAVLGFIAVYATLSKAALMYALIPYLCYMYARAYEVLLIRRLFLTFTLLTILVLPITYFGAMVLREEVQEGYSANRVQVYEEYKAASAVTGGGVFSTIFGTISNIFARVTGGSEMMAIVAANPQPINVISSLLIGQGSSLDSGVSESIREVFNVSVGIQSGHYSGKSFGLWGVLFLSHQYAYVFIGSVVLALLLVYTERLVWLVFGDAAAIGTAFWFALAVWESGFDNFWPQWMMLVTVAHIYRLMRREGGQ